jgi:hypothetical protein
MKTIPTKQPQQAAPAPAAASAAPAAPESVNTDLIRPAPTPDLNPRNRAAADIAKRANQDADAAASESVPEGDGETMPAETAAPAAQQVSQQVTEPTETEAAPAAAAEPASSEPAPEVAAQPAASPATPGIDPNAEYDIVVDGQPMKLKGSQILSRVQKSEAADYRLQLASKLFEEAKRAAGMQAQPPAQGAAPHQQAPSQPAQLDEAQLAQLIQFGTTEQATEAIRALRAQRPDVVTQQDLQQFLRQGVSQQVRLEIMFAEGKSLVEKEYGDLLADPYLSKLFFVRENELRKAGDTRAHVELYKEIGEDIRKHFNRPSASRPAAPAPAQPATPSLAAKLAAKVAAPAAPKLASARLDGGSQVQKPKSREDIINEMRTARGQHALTVR